MRRPKFIARQSRRPSGILGRVIAWIMERETAAQNDAALAALAVRPGDRILEIGFGHGRTLERLAAAASTGFVAGIDHAADMVATAERRCRALVRSGRIELRAGDSRALPYPDASFDKVLTVHTLYFWCEPAAHFLEMRRVLKPSGACVLGFRTKDDANAAAFPDSVYTFYARDEVRRFFEAAGFAAVDLSEPVAGLVVARAVRRD